ncbi:MAG: hypothetical protein EA402_03915 [Planctomycetota bacterium]|nr:MAG: hypothetical protein EA402_03915 [Planctomycetota bacterium]
MVRQSHDGLNFPPLTTEPQLGINNREVTKRVIHIGWVYRAAITPWDNADSDRRHGATSASLGKENKALR